MNPFGLFVHNQNGSYTVPHKCVNSHIRKKLFFINSKMYNYIKCLPFIVCVCNLYYLILIKAFGLLLTYLLIVVVIRHLPGSDWYSTVSVQQGEGLQMLLFFYSNWMGLDPHCWAVHCLSGMFITHLPLYIRAVSVQCSNHTANDTMWRLYFIQRFLFFWFITLLFAWIHFKKLCQINTFFILVEFRWV